MISFLLITGIVTNAITYAMDGYRKEDIGAKVGGEDTSKTYLPHFSNNEPHIYILHLDSDTERQEYMTAMMKKAEILNYKFFSAVNGKSYENIVARNAISKKNSNKMKLGEIGHYMSFSKILDDIIRNGYEHTLIFEDDVCLSKHFKQQFNSIMEELPSDYDVLSFSWAKNHENMGEPIKEGSSLLVPYQINIYESKKIYLGLESLLISLKGAIRIRNKMFKMMYQTDKYIDMLKNIGYINLYVLRKPITFQNVRFHSNIQTNPNKKKDLVVDECSVI